MCASHSPVLGSAAPRRSGRSNTPTPPRCPARRPARRRPPSLARVEGVGRPDQPAGADIRLGQRDRCDWCVAGDETLLLRKHLQAQGVAPVLPRDLAEVHSILLNCASHCASHVGFRLHFSLPAPAGDSLPLRARFALPPRKAGNNGCSPMKRISGHCVGQRMRGCVWSVSIVRASDYTMSGAATRR